MYRKGDDGMKWHRPEYNEKASELKERDVVYLRTDIEEHKNEIETDLGYSVKWDYKEGSKASSVDIRSDFRLDLKNSDLSKGYEWLLNKAEDFKRVFRKYL